MGFCEYFEDMPDPGPNWQFIGDFHEADDRITYPLVGGGAARFPVPRPTTPPTGSAFRPCGGCGFTFCRCPRKGWGAF